MHYLKISKYLQILIPEPSDLDIFNNPRTILSLTLLRIFQTLIKILKFRTAKKKLNNGCILSIRPHIVAL
jgi:hypothetical protein